MSTSSGQEETVTSFNSSSKDVLHDSTGFLRTNSFSVYSVYVDIFSYYNCMNYNIT